MSTLSDNTGHPAKGESIPARYGLLRIGKVQIAVPAQALSEIVPRGASLHPCPLPSQRFQVCGTLLHRGAAVPILNIAALLGTQLETQECTSGNGPIALVQSGDAIVGLMIDEAVRVSDPTNSVVLDLHGEGLEQAFFRSYLRSQDQVAYILEPEKVVDCLSSRLAQDEANPLFQASQGDPQKGERALIAVVRWGDYVFGIRSQWVVSARPACPLQETGMDDRLVRGFLPFENDNRRAIPVVNLTPFLGLPNADAETVPAQYLLLGDEVRRAAFGITSVCGLDYLEVDHLDPIQLKGIIHAEFFEGALYSKKYGQMLMLDGAKILGAPSIQGMVIPPPPPPPEFVDEFGAAEEEWDREPEKATEVVCETVPETFVVYRAGQSFYATTTQDLDGILLKPQLSTRLGHTHDAMEGFIHWRGASVPVLNLTRCLGFGSSLGKSPGEWVLIHRKGDALVGFLVESVDSLTLAKPKVIPTQVAERRDPSVRLSTSIPVPNQAISFKDVRGSRTAFVLDLGSVDGCAAAPKAMA